MALGLCGGMATKSQTDSFQTVDSALNLFSQLLPPCIRTAEGLIVEQETLLRPEEELAVSNAVQSRRLEFAAGRNLARRALASFGYADASLPANANRVPVWPRGVVGSITHTSSHAAAAVGSTADGIAAIGIDLEPAEDLDRDVWPLVLTPTEQHNIENCSGGLRDFLAKLHFSAKECTFKCQYTLSNQMLDFIDCELAFELDQQRFSATLNRDCPPFKDGDTLTGVFRMGSGLLATAMYLDSQAIEAQQASETDAL